MCIHRNSLINLSTLCPYCRMLCKWHGNPYILIYLNDNVECERVSGERQVLDGEVTTTTPRAITTTSGSRTPSAMSWK